MSQIKENKERERRIDMEIVVDAYNEVERAMGWYYYLQDGLKFPFKARCIQKRSTSPLKIGDLVEVIGMGEEDLQRYSFVKTKQSRITVESEHNGLN